MLELIRQFRSAPSSRAIAVPILVISGHSEENWRARSLAAGAADLLTKPFDPAVLVTRIAAAVAPGRSGPTRTPRGPDRRRSRALDRAGTPL